MSLYSIMKALCSSPYTKRKVFSRCMIASHCTKATSLVTLTRIVACPYTCLCVKANNHCCCYRYCGFTSYSLRVVIAFIARLLLLFMCCRNLVAKES